MREGYGSHFVFLSTALERTALTSSHQVRYEQAKHVDGLQSDGWILLKCFHSRVMAGLPWRLSRSSLKTKTPIVGCPDTHRFDPYCKTALGVQRDLVKKPIKAYTTILQRAAIMEFTVTPSCLAACFLVTEILCASS